MIITPPSFWHGRESLKWLVAMIVAFLGHWGFVLAFGNKAHPVPEPMAMPAVMLEFADFPQSATQVESFSVGMPQQITQDSIATPVDVMPETIDDPKISVEETSNTEEPEIVVEKKPKESPKKDPKIVKNPQKIVKKKINVERKKPQEKTNEVDSQASALANSAPPKGDDSKTAAPNDSDGKTQQFAQNWQSRVLGQLRRHQSYPSAALENRIEGTTLLHIRIDSQGMVLLTQVYKSSGHHLLDNEAVKIVQRASPLPIPPEHLVKQNTLSFNIPIRFNIKEYRKLKNTSSF